MEDEMQILVYTLTALFILSFAYRVVYMAVRVLNIKRRVVKGNEHRFGVLIAARNEKNVIAELIDSIHRQDYPQELIDIFIVADNCTDNTADIAREHGAHVYERFDKDNVSKGHALQYLVGKMRAEHIDERYDAFFVFDADNLLDPHYISAINEVFSAGNEIVVGYRTAKNFGDNWVSGSYGFYFLYESEFANRSRDLLGTSCFLSGTGCMFSQAFIDRFGGWQWTGLTEDLECTSVILKNGYKIAYCTDAVLYDEQPTSFAVSIKQRIRWVRGYIQAIGENFTEMFPRMFGKGGFAIFDFLMNFAPLVLFILNAIADSINMGLMLAHGAGIAAIALHVLSSLASIYGGLFLMSLASLIFEWKRIRCEWYKKIIYALLFPVFMYSYLIVYVGIFFGNQNWEHMEHKVSVRIDEI